MSAAHELAERGFDVTVFETGAEPGGKARSMAVPRTGAGGRRDLPGEHGFRFFPGFYRHLPDTLRRIRVPDGGSTAFDHLVPAEDFQIARAGRRELIGPIRFPQTPDDVRDGVRFLFRYAAESGVSAPEMAYVLNRLFLLLASCDERRFGQYEELSWWEFSGAADRSQAYQLFLADGLTRSLVAARARELSARTGGLIVLQLLFDMGRADGQVDRLLDGPTNDVWIDPWLAQLRGRGVDYRRRHDVQGIRCAGDGDEEIRADHYVPAPPVEQMQLLADRALCRADPALAGVHALETRWMNGIMFYFDRPVPIVRGHTIYLDSEWSLTSISQQQFLARRPRRVRRRIGPGHPLGRHPRMAARRRQRQERDEVHAPGDPRRGLAAARRASQRRRDAGARGGGDRHLVPGSGDPVPEPIEATNLELLLIDTAGSWRSRPDAVPAERRKTHGRALANLYLAADYVRTYTDLATMEVANEAARRAVNGILDADEAQAERCMVRKLDEPLLLLAPARALDRILHRLGRAPRPVLQVKPDGRVEVAGPVGEAMVGAQSLAAGLPGL